ncbi:cysteine-rich RLK protein 2 [Perilla frutescens var. hirtella]|uniref:Cysteine-rich RLK protein 2 n=1 Tax=Perilla frutescens var. hirtella TaxID=608512 RepID=A0AAD4NYN5_PERFH|nr:cysteine-rich RLK protein 2 [Perilla frutescens var. hirtella]
MAIMILKLVILLLLQDASFADPRAKAIKLICGTQLQQDTNVYVPNFFATMENVSVQIRTSGFGTAGTGSGPDGSYGFAQCYRDIPLTECALCYAEARTNVPQCHPANGGMIFLDGCFMRYANYSFFHEYVGPNDQGVCGIRTRQNPAFQDSARQALSRVVSSAPTNNGFGWAHVAVTDDESAYVLADCWRTINASACRACLEKASASISRCLPSSEGRALNTGCFMMYSDTNFLNPMRGTGNSRGRVAAIVIAAISAAAALAIGAVIGFHMWKNRTIEKRRKGDAEKLLKNLNDRNLHFKYSTLEKATNSYNEANKLGQGGFGTVYKGVLADGREIAVKRLFFDNKHRAADFYNEVNIISSVEHKNLVRLLGCSCLGPESLLVYEYLPNKSLDQFIFDSDKGKTLNWEKRMEIIVGIAEGLVYLHEKTETRIIHRDIKASNILLDSKLRPKIADFGLARSFQQDQTHISTAIAGTLGYMAPEYLAHGQLTEKVDVYSFGVLLLEIVTGKQNNGSQDTDNIDSLITIAWKHFQQRSVEEQFDPNLMLHDHNSVSTKNQILRAVHVALLCTQEASSRRPSMSMALLMLAEKDELPAPTNPPFIDEKTMELNAMLRETSPILNNGNVTSTATISHSIFHPR